VPEPFDRPLRIGLLLDSLVVPRWVESILATLRDSDYATIELVVLDDSPATAPSVKDRFRMLPQLPFVVYSKLDQRAFGATVKHNAFAPTPVGGLLRDVPTMRVVPHRGKFVDRFAEDDVEAVLDHELDVILRFGFRIIKGRILGAARHGVWSYHHGDNRRYRGGPALFWEMADRDPVSGTVLQVLTEDLDAGRLIYRSASRTDQTSLFRNRNETYWKTARFIERRLADLHRRGPVALASASAAIGDVVPSSRITRTPGPLRTTTFALRMGLEVARGQLRHRTMNGDWFVAWAPREDGLPGIDHTPRFRVIPSPRGQFLADPFIADHDGRTFIFVESCPHRRSAGVIAVLELGDDSVSDPVTVLERDYHLSYPAVFRWGDDWYMTPETADNRTVELYRAVEFPWRWELDTVLLRDVTAVDPTLLEHDGRWWLFANVASVGASANDELHLFWADSPRGPFAAHPANPVVSDVRRARPAGMPFVEDGALYRPAQNCAIRYGHSMAVHRVDQLDPEHYHEVPVGQILPDWLPGAVCTHTLNMTSRYIVSDGMRVVPRWSTDRPGQDRRSS
jgi:hypothetical protein